MTTKIGWIVAGADLAWPVLAVVAIAGLASVVTAFPAPDGRRES